MTTPEHETVSHPCEPVQSVGCAHAVGREPQLVAYCAALEGPGGPFQQHSLCELMSYPVQKMAIPFAAVQADAADVQNGVTFARMQHPSLRARLQGQSLASGGRVGFPPSSEGRASAIASRSTPASASPAPPSLRGAYVMSKFERLSHPTGARKAGAKTRTRQRTALRMLTTLPRARALRGRARRRGEHARGGLFWAKPTVQSDTMKRHRRAQGPPRRIRGSRRSPR